MDASHALIAIAQTFAAHRARVALCLLFAIVAAIETSILYVYGSAGFFLSWCDVVLLVAMAYFVKTSGVLIVLLFAVTSMLPGIGSSIALICCYPALRHARL